jgi:hypothetical protein
LSFLLQTHPYRDLFKIQGFSSMQQPRGSADIKLSRGRALGLAKKAGKLAELAFMFCKASLLYIVEERLLLCRREEV